MGTAVRGWLAACFSILIACEDAPPAPQPPPAAQAVPAATPAAAPMVYFQKLRAFLPEAPDGFTQTTDRGSTGAYGDVSVSEAERVFESAEREISVRIVDTSMGPRLAQSIRAAVEQASDRTPADPTAPILLRDALGFVRYDPAEAHAEANLLVGDRYVVAITSRGFRNTVEVRRIARSLDLSGLAQLR